jgi:hypothetical protein
VRHAWVLPLLAPVLAALAAAPTNAQIPVDRSGYRSECGVGVEVEGPRISVSWPIADGEHGRLVLDLRRGEALFENLGMSPTPQGEVVPILTKVDPVTFITAGSRESPADRPKEMSVFNVFFDSPAKRAYATDRARLEPEGVKIASRPGRATIAIDGLSAGQFGGALEISVFVGSRLVHVEAVVMTQQEDRAFFYDAGLVAKSPSWTHFAWTDTEGQLHRETARAEGASAPAAVRHRMIVTEAPGGSIACFPPPHQYFFPRDFTDNQRTVWNGRNHHGLEPRAGFGIRQTATGGGNFVPWFNAPPGTTQRLGVFYLLSKGKAEEATREVLRYTHGDRFPELPGRVSFTSHWHMALTMAAMNAGAGKAPPIPDAVKMFQDMNVNIVHLAEFHGDGHPRDPGAVRLKEMAAMFAECARLSRPNLLVLPGEEANADLTDHAPGKHTGHWLYLFPHPVYWTMQRKPEVPFSETVDPYGKVYHVGSKADVLRLLKEEHGLAWTAHPRIKSSNFTPDAYRHEDFYRDPVWLGAAWKAMPADLSQPRLGTRVLDLLDDMANWGDKKYVPGEVDVFKIDHAHELYGHMNINYLQLERIPKFADDWSPVLDSLRHGKFFVTTGEVLLTEFQVGGKSSGETLSLAPGTRPALTMTLEWTFPMRFAEVMSGDGQKVYREPIDLTSEPPFGKKTLTLRPELKERKWVRVEAWDVAANGAFSQPVWLEPARERP